MSYIKTPTFKIVLFKNRQRKDGAYPIALRLTFNRRHKYYTLKSLEADYQGTLTCKKENWSDETGRIVLTNKNTSRKIKKIVSTINTTLSLYETRVKEAIDLQRNKPFSFAYTENHVFHSYTRSIKIEEYLSTIIQELEKEGRLRTKKLNKDLRNRVIEFDKHILLNDLDRNFLGRFQNFLKRKGNAPSTIGIYLRTLKSAYNKAITNDVINVTKSAFIGIKIPKSYGKKLRLKKEQVVMLFNEYDKLKEKERFYVGLFLFSYMCRGINLKDILNLRWDENVDLYNDRINFLRCKIANQKEDKTGLSIKIEPKIAEILNEHGDPSGPYLFPVFEEGLKDTTKDSRQNNLSKKINKTLQSLAPKLGITMPKKFVFGVARHTYATVLKNSDITVEKISEAIGHSDPQVTKHYLDSFEEEVHDDTYKHLL